MRTRTSSRRWPRHPSSLLLAGCASGGDRHQARPRPRPPTAAEPELTGELTVYAAASLKAAFDELEMRVRGAAPEPRGAAGRLRRLEHARDPAHRGRARRRLRLGRREEHAEGRGCRPRDRSAAVRVEHPRDRRAGRQSRRRRGPERSRRRQRDRRAVRSRGAVRRGIPDAAVQRRTHRDAGEPRAERDRGAHEGGGRRGRRRTRVRDRRARPHRCRIDRARGRGGRREPLPDRRADGIRRTPRRRRRSPSSSSSEDGQAVLASLGFGEP